jgi:choice-of-anchor A domain-containing protein
MQTRLGVNWRTGGAKELLGIIMAASAAAAATFQAPAAFSLGDAANYALIFDDGNGNTLQVYPGAGANGLAVVGNVGIGGCGNLDVHYGSIIDGNVNFSGSENLSGGGTINGTVSANQTTLATDISNLSRLSSTLKGETGAGVSVNGNATITASSGALDSSGNYVFNVNSFTLGSGSTLTINGDSSHGVVLNFASGSPTFGGTIVLSGGITSDQVLFNVTGNGNTLTLGSSGSAPSLTGTFLDPGGVINMNNAVLSGRLFGGGAWSDESIGSDAVEIISPVPEPGTILAGALLLLPFAASTVRIARQGRPALAGPSRFRVQAGAPPATL